MFVSSSIISSFQDLKPEVLHPSIGFYSLINLCTTYGVNFPEQPSVLLFQECWKIILWLHQNSYPKISIFYIKNSNRTM